jgi:ABC-type transporter Mla subunit MlaD
MTEILWSTDPASQRALLLVIGLAALVAVTIHLPLAVRALGLWLLERQLRQRLENESRGKKPGDATQASLRESLRDSAIGPSFHEFERRWQTAQVGEDLERAPIRLIDILDEHPLLPFGPRRSLLPILPGLFLAVGVFAVLIGLIPSLGVFAAGELPSDASAAWLADQLGLALRASAWGFLCAMGAALGGRLLEGAFEARSHGLDAIVEQAFGSVSPGELAEITRQTQQRSLDTLGDELVRFASELNERLERGLLRIEQSTSRSASLVSQEQRGALHTVVQELSLSVRQGVEHHLGELRSALQRAVEHQGSVTGGLAETFQRLVENTQTQERVARTLAESATAVDEAARSMHTSSVEMQPVLEHLGVTSRALAETASRMDATQQVVARSAEGVRGALDHAAAGVDDQRQLLELSLGEIRRAMMGLEDGLADSLKRALRELDGALSATVVQLRDTLGESNETIDRLAIPVRAAEGSMRETHLALDRVRQEVEALGQWMSQTARPLRAGLDDVEGRVEEIARALVEFTSQSRQMDKTMEALRLEIHEESRRLQGTGSELGRRLERASDALGLLESTTSEAARRAQPGAPTGPGSSLERRWAPPLLDRHPDRDRPGDAPASIPGDEAPRSSNRDLPISDYSDYPDYRVGAARAHGPDPYARFDTVGPLPAADSAAKEPLPTRERGLGQDLNLSGLLGPSPRDDAATRTDREADPRGLGPDHGDDAEARESKPVRPAADERE